MPRATSADLVFCCPNCGADLRASRRDSGSVLDCHLCGEHVRVPFRPHPVEAKQFSPERTPRIALESAQRGLRFLVYGFFLILLEYSLLTAVYTFWLQTDGPATVMRRQTVSLANLLTVFWIIEILVVFARTACRWWGYAQCEALAEQVASRGWMVAARYSTILRTVGYCIIVWPWLARWDWPLEGGAAGFVKLGQFAWMVGAGLEFVVLIPWFRWLQQFEDHQLARQVKLYGLWTVIGVVLGTVGVSLVGLVVIIAVRSQGGSPDAHGRVNPFEIPQRGWLTAGGFVLAVGLYWVFLAILYYRLLQTLRLSVLPGRGSEPATNP